MRIMIIILFSIGCLASCSSPEGELCQYHHPFECGDCGSEYCGPDGCQECKPRPEAVDIRRGIGQCKTYTATCFSGMDDPDVDGGEMCIYVGPEDRCQALLTRRGCHDEWVYEDSYCDEDSYRE